MTQSLKSFNEYLKCSAILSLNLENGSDFKILKLGSSEGGICFSSNEAKSKP